MKIVIIDTTVQGPLIGGAQTFLPHLIGGMVQKGHEVHLVTSGKPDERVKPAIINSGAILHDSIWKKKTIEQDAARVLARWVNKLQPDIYLVSVSPDIGWLALPFIEPEIATMTIGHTDSETFYRPVRYYRTFLTKSVGVSEQIRSQFINGCGLADNNTRWIPYGVIGNSEPPSEEKSDVLKLAYVGRLEEEQKRVSDLITIIRSLSAMGLDFRFSIIGDGPERNRVQMGLQEEIAKGKVTMHGWLPSNEVITILKVSSIFVLTSAYEGFCIALVEAMANGCCPLVTRIQSGNEQLIKQGISGLIFPIGDTIGFAKAIAELGIDSARLHNLRVMAWESGRNFSIEKMVESYEQYFEEAILSVSSDPRHPDPEFPPMPGCRSVYPLWMRRIKKLFLN